MHALRYGDGGGVLLPEVYFPRGDPGKNLAVRNVLPGGHIRVKSLFFHSDLHFADQSLILFPRSPCSTAFRSEVLFLRQLRAGEAP